MTPAPHPSKHAADLALARACAEGDDAAWERFIAEYRLILYASARALTLDEATARELADSLWAELYGVWRTRASVEPASTRRSLLEHFHGRARLSTSLRSVLAQRHVDRLRANARLDSLDADDAVELAAAADGDPPDPDRTRYRALFDAAVGATVEALGSPDRLRLGLYYVQDLTLDEIGRVTGEHEATVSRNLARTRRMLPQRVEATLTDEHRLDATEVAACYRYAVDVGSFDLAAVLQRKPRGNR